MAEKVWIRNSQLVFNESQEGWISSDCGIVFYFFTAVVYLLLYMCAFDKCVSKDNED